MEKYSKWKDPATGIHPFLPPKPKTLNVTASDKVLYALKFILSPILLVLRLPILVIIPLWIALFTTLFGLVPVPSLRRGLVRYVHFAGCRILLFFLGFHYIRTSALHPRQRHKQVTTSPGGGIGAGDVIVCNYVSYAQHLYFAFRFSPMFLVPLDDGSGKVCAFGLGGMLWHTLFSTALDTTRAKPLASVLQQTPRHQPFVLYPEGTTSNGLEIIRFQPVFPPSLPSGLRVHIVAVRLEPAAAPSSFSPTFTVGHPLLHIVQLAAQLFNSMHVCYCASDANPSSSTTTTPTMPSLGGVGAASASFGEECAKVMASLFQMHIAPLGSKEKAEFVEYYAKIERGGYGVDAKKRA